MSNLIENILSARKSGVPLIAIETQDQPATIEALCNAINGQAPKVVWNRIDGLKGLGQPDKETKAESAGCAAVRALGEKQVQDSHQPVIAFKLCYNLIPGTVVFAMNAHAYINEPPVVQAIQNLRETYKENKRTLILLGPTFAGMRQELQADVVVLTEPLPTDEQIESVIADLHAAAGGDLDKDKLPHQIDAVRGLPALFTVEQVVAMSFRSKKLDMDALWERKAAAINATQGLTIGRGSLRYEDLAGMDNIMTFLKGLRGKVRVVLHLDEIEKMMAGSGGDQTDSSGVSSDQLGVILKYMERLRWKGLILFGVPGAGKTALCDSTATEFEVPLMSADLGAMKGRYVGDSEGAIRQAFKVIEGIGGTEVLVMATCNKMRSLPPELRRRFWLGNWFFDVPTVEEQKPIKAIYEKKLKLDPKVHGAWPNTADWTGSEIRNCAELAALRNSTLVEAAKFIVPIAQADPESVDQVRAVADGRFLSVSYEGRFQINRQDVAAATPKKRTIAN